MGQAVRAAGPVRHATAARFAEWERDLRGEVDPERELIPVYQIATRVVSATGP